MSDSKFQFSVQAKQEGTDTLLITVQVKHPDEVVPEVQVAEEAETVVPAIAAAVAADDSSQAAHDRMLLHKIMREYGIESDNNAYDIIERTSAAATRLRDEATRLRDENERLTNILYKLTAPIWWEQRVRGLSWLSAVTHTDLANLSQQLGDTVSKLVRGEDK